MLTQPVLGVFGSLPLCHRDLAAQAVLAESLVQWPEAGTVNHEQQQGDFTWLGAHHHPALQGVPSAGPEHVKMLRFGQCEDMAVGSAADRYLQAPILGVGAQRTISGPLD